MIASKPRILETSIEDQFDQLVCSSLRSIGPSFLQPVILLIDGLDEYDSEEKTSHSQRQVLHALDMLVTKTDLPFLVLVASRNKHQITMAFKELGSNVDSIFLDEKYTTEKDI